MTLLDQIDRLRELAEAQADGKQVEILDGAHWEKYTISSTTPLALAHHFRIKPEPESWKVARFPGGDIFVYDNDYLDKLDSIEIFEVVRKEPEA